MPPAELEPRFLDSEPNRFQFGEGEAEAARALRFDGTRVGLDEDYAQRLAAAPPVCFRSAWPAEQTWYLLYTSGTTGRPKGVVYNYRMALANYVNLRTAIDLVSGDATLCFLPLFHTSGINLHALPTLLAGGRVIMIPAFDADTIVGLLRAQRIDHFFAVPTVYQELLGHPGFAALPLARVRSWGAGGAPLPDAVAERFRDLGLRLCAGMGMTETGPTAFLAAPADAWTKIGSVGKPQLLCRVRIVDKSGVDVADGEVGEILFAGPGVTPGYWSGGAIDRSSFTEDGWLCSGDLGWRDSDGCYFVAGRRKDMFISGGENVYPAEVENVLCAHPEVAEAAVVPVEDPRWGEVGRAFVRPRSGRSPRSEDLDAYCRTRLAAYKVPRRFEIVADFPRTAAGKIRKHLLR
jgi:fatty-acyl-CoA synthase